MLNFLLHSPIVHFAKKTPQHVALSFNGQQMTYAELDAASNQLANALLDQGLHQRDRVGIYMNKSLEMGVAIYGILKAGGAFVPLDPFAPVERISFMLGDCGIRFVVSGSNQEKPLAQLAKTEDTMPMVFGVAPTDALPTLSWEAIQAYPPTAPDVTLIDQGLAYIMYTSGSTGVPKGMMHSHHGGISFARWGAIEFGLTAADKVANHAPLQFDLSIFDFFSTSQVGGTVVLVPEPVTKFPASWTKYVDDEKISVVFTVPFTLLQMLHSGAMDQRDLSSLRWILFGGEPFPPKHLRALMLKMPQTRFVNIYGPAEAPSCTWYEIPPLAEDYDEPIPIGTVSQNSAQLILDEDDAPCGVGEAGELLIRSSTLMKGYWNRPELNERAFYEQAAFGRFKDLYYRTGDIVMLHEDGLLRFLGRKDRMVKTRGYRVELDEVEAAITSHPSVEEAAAFAIPDGRGSKAIHAVVTLNSAETVTTGDIMRHARGIIPAYALPQRLTIASELPRTNTGKINRRALAERAENSS